MVEYENKLHAGTSNSYLVPPTYIWYSSNSYLVPQTYIWYTFNS